MSTRRRPPSRLRGVMLLEVLVAIVIFAVGLLGLARLQSTAIQQSGSARYRAEAMMLANDLIGQMWVTDRNYGTINPRFATGGPDYNAWAARVQAQLPGAVAAPPTVAASSIAPGASGANPSTRVTITVNWKAPSEAASEPAHSVVVSAQIR